MNFLNVISAVHKSKTQCNVSGLDGRPHGNNLLICPVRKPEICGGCVFKHICKDGEWCSECGSNVIKSESNGIQRKKQDIITPLTKELHYKQRQRKTLETQMIKSPNSQIEAKIKELTDEICTLEGKIHNAKTGQSEVIF